MKKRLIVLVLVVTFLFSNNIFAGNNINIFVDGNRVLTDAGGYVYSGSGYISLNVCSDFLGIDVKIISKTKTIYLTKGNTKAKFQVGNAYGTINGKKIKLKLKPKTINKKIYIPYNYISEYFGLEAGFDNKTKVITIITKKPNLEKISFVDQQKLEFRQTFTFKNNGDQTNAKFKVLMGAVSNSLYQTNDEIIVSPQPNEIEYDDYGNKYAIIKTENINKGEEIKIIITKKLTNKGIKYNVNPQSATNNYESMYNLYTKPEKLIESDNQKIIEKAKELAKGQNNAFDIAKKTFEFVNTYMTYDENQDIARKGALNALNTGKGVCEDYSKLFVALLRANNIPARSVLGFWIQSEYRDKLSYDSWTDISSLAHEWPEFYIKDYGWVVCEPTFLYTINGIKSVPWEQFANQNSNGHIIYGYNSNEENYVSWTMEGRGELDISLDTVNKEIIKAR